LWQIGQRTNEGQRDGVENSMLKLFMAQVEQALFRDGIEYGPDELSPLLTGDFVEYLYSRAESIMGGTSQIQKNIIASRVLGMPRQ
jgi:alkylation response protein AidB-like acyl-CoA dehydrogenase